MRVGVIGAGIMGLATGLELARRGHHVTIYERDVVGNELASSTDRSKAFRFAYPDPFYADLGRRALPLWRELERAAGEELLVQCGLLYLDVDREEAVRTERALGAIGAPHELLDGDEIRSRFPAWRLPSGALGAWDPAGGFVRADRALTAFAGAARAAGVEIREHEPVTPTELRVDVVVLAAGPWSAGLIPGLPLRTTLQETVYATVAERAEFESARFPVFIEARSRFYGFPADAEGALKFARHEPGPSHPPLTRQAEASAGFVESCRRFWRESMPALSDARIVSSRRCIYNNTPDEDFLIGRDESGIVLCTGFSGHGFKFAPLVGRLCAQMICGEPTDVDVSRFAPARLSPFAR